MRDINRSSDIPLYQQIVSILMEEISKGELKPGDKLMPEVELAKTFDVSRMTVRQALDEMIRQRIVTRKRGYGTFLLTKPVQRILRPNIITGFYDDFSSQGRDLVSIVIEREVVLAPDDIADGMELSQNARVVKLTRVRCCDSIPVVLDESYLPVFMWEHIKGVDLSNRSLFKLIEQKVKMVPERGEITMRACTATSYLAKHLGLAVGDPVLYAKMVNYAEHGRPMQIGNLYCPETLDIRLPVGKYAPALKHTKEKK